MVLNVVETVTTMAVMAVGVAVQHVLAPLYEHTDHVLVEVVILDARKDDLSRTVHSVAKGCRTRILTANSVLVEDNLSHWERTLVHSSEILCFDRGICL